MNRGTGIGLMVFGIVLVIVGAIMRYAVNVQTRGFNIHDAGIILLLAGIGIVVISLVILVVGGRSRSTVRESVRETPEGQQRTEERTDWDTP
jgi:Na+-transporting methylmalonyl-CoA/oxaloacetate decarboxylase gamma subunit